MKGIWKRIVAMGLCVCLASSLMLSAAWADGPDGSDESQAAEQTEPDKDTALPGDSSEVPSGEDPDAAETPEDPENPEDPETPENPENPETPENPGEPEGPQEQAPNRLPLQQVSLLSGHVRYMVGYTTEQFHPNDALTRAQAAQVLYSLLDTSAVRPEALPYRDVGASEWFHDAISTLYSAGILLNGSQFRPNAAISRAEFVDMLVMVARATGKLPLDAGSVAEVSRFVDVPAGYWALSAIETAADQGWVSGYPDRIFHPEGTLSRAETCAVISTFTGRTGDKARANALLSLGAFTDVKPSHWAAAAIMEAATPHTPADGTSESWASVNTNVFRFSGSTGVHCVDGKLYYIDRNHYLTVSQPLCAYTADCFGVLTQVSSSYQLPYVPYISQIDGIYAWVGCEPVSALMGLKANGFALNVDVRTFLNRLPTTTSDPEKGFVGSPYRPDPSKRTRTTIYPAKLAEYCNTYTDGKNVCADFRGATIEELQRELLAGNQVVAYMTLWWENTFYRYYNIEGQTQRLVSNNHAVLVYGYDPARGYLVSDPYNYYNRGHVHQYWENAAVFERIWNERKVGMIIR